MAPRASSAPFILANLEAAVAERRIPTLTFWNRLEGRPRAEGFDRALKAEVRDALWMVTRQWQLGELRGDDAASPIFAKLCVDRAPLNRYRAGTGQVEPFDETVPLEAQVERRPLTALSLDLRLAMGRQFLKLMRTLAGVDLAAVTQQLLARYPIAHPNPTDLADAAICAHPEAFGAYAAVAGRRLDGGAIYRHLSGPTPGHAYDGISALTGRESEADALGARFVAWFRGLVTQPEQSPNDAWEPDRLEYRFDVAAPSVQGEQTFTADEYFHGHLDWYNLDLPETPLEMGATGEPERSVRTMLPTPVGFNGMPNTRWWAFEDGRTNLGAIKPDTTDLPKLLLMEFGLVFANDWFLVPFSVPVGSWAKVRGLAVTDVFGDRTWVEPAGKGADDDWQRWAMFNLSRRGQQDVAADTSLLVLPTAAKVQEGPLRDELLLVRDEMANMVWAVEKTITLPSGDRKPGAEAARELRAFYEAELLRRLGGAPPLPVEGAATAKIRYQVMTSVPEQWIPFVPVHVPGDYREIQLQRAAMPRILEGDPDAPKKVRPRTSLLRQGLDATPAQPYFLHEEEVPRSGVRVTQAFQRTRWRDGRAWLWLGVRKQTGRGEATSGLQFDRAANLPPRSP